jgi:DNA-binding NarL/FixJ family response regulator
VYWNRALVAWLRQDLDQAADLALEALRLNQACGADDRYGLAHDLGMLALITADQRRHRRAATLLGAAAAMWADVGASATSYRYLASHHDACARRIREAIGDTAFAHAFAAGQNLALEDVLAFAQEEERGAVPSSSPSPSPPTPLTRREREVAALVAEGLSNKEIAARLVIARRTAEGHVERILQKLGFASRAQLAAWVTERRTAEADDR